MDQKERLAIAQWVLERNLAWISASEVKVGAIVTIDMAMSPFTTKTTLFLIVMAKAVIYLFVITSD